jgi:DNA replication ATP-dependent helicase Dna2
VNQRRGALLTSLQVKNPDARRGGLDVSLFRLLADAHPGAVVDLAHQYRMNEDIMLLSNKLIYDDKLACGSEQVARQALVLPNSAADWLHAPETGSNCTSGCWLQDLLNEEWVAHWCIRLWTDNV